ncbi:MAG TPA: lipopolysaccharide transport periplasmic protein LptA [Herminiimonas sp.]|jgi:lipopolysaccharide export system protein LptA|nr:lipopolysaccharide transport periplasmic protein LptA [Herminiimonas sp.]
MNRLFSTAFLLIGLVTTSVVFAEKADSTKPTNVEANHMEYDDVKQINTFTGNVVLTRGTILMKANKMVVTQDPSGYQYVTLYAAPGSLASFKQKRDGGPDQWIDGQAERIEYDDKAEIMKLFSKARMRRLEGVKPTDEVEGEYISYDTRAEYFTVHNTSNGDSKNGGGRIKAVIQPRVDKTEKKDK